MNTILLAEDEIVIGRLIKEALERKSFKVIWAKDGVEAYKLFKEQQPNICILDVMMPYMNGFDLAQKIRSGSKDMPILFLTARSETNDVIKGYEVGGNDYLKKPFSLEELLLRVNELFKRITAKKETIEEKNEIYKIGIYSFNPLTQTLQIRDEIIKLSFKESALLKALMLHKNALTPRKDTLLEIWGDDNFFNSRTMDVYIAKLRKYFNEDPAISIINIRGFGFKLVDQLAH